MKHEEFKGEKVTFIETMSVREGVVCDVYEFDNTKEKHFSVIS